MSHLCDHLGSVLALATPDGEIVESYEYEPYGLPTIYDDEGEIVASRTSAVGNRFMFTGREWEPDGEFYHYRHRTYSPHEKRFMQRDPIGLAGGWNVYAYCGGDPVNWVDPGGDARVQRGWGLKNSQFEIDTRTFDVEDELLRVEVAMRALAVGKSSCYLRSPVTKRDALAIRLITRHLRMASKSGSIRVGYPDSFGAETSTFTKWIVMHEGGIRTHSSSTEVWDNNTIGTLYNEGWHLWDLGTNTYFLLDRIGYAFGGAEEAGNGDSFMERESMRFHTMVEDVLDAYDAWRKSCSPSS